MAKQVIKYEDTNGKLHDTLEQARKADNESILLSDLYDIAQSINTYNMSSEDLAAALHENLNSIRLVMFDNMDLTEIPQEQLESEYCILKNELSRRKAP